MNDLSTTSSVLIVICHFPDFLSAREISGQMVEKKLAACCNILDGCTSIFRWKDKIELASEIPVYFKTTLTAYAELEMALREAHPYEVPDILALPVEFGAIDYLQWVNDNVLPT